MSSGPPPLKQAKISDFMGRSRSQQSAPSQAAALSRSASRQPASPPQPAPPPPSTAASSLPHATATAAAAGGGAAKPATETEAKQIDAVMPGLSASAAAVAADSPQDPPGPPPPTRKELPKPRELGDIFPPVERHATHTILCLFWSKDSRTPPKPRIGDDKWDRHHVRMPCSSQNAYQTSSDAAPIPRWRDIESALKRTMSTAQDVQEAILSYNERYREKWNFDALKAYIRRLSAERKDRLFNNILPSIARLALRLPQLIPMAIPLLRTHQNACLTMSQEQAACLLANAFFCTFPRRNHLGNKSEYSSYPDINFNRLFAGGHGSEEVRMAKLDCIFHYFERIGTDMPRGLLTFQRQSIQSPISWENKKVQLHKFQVYAAGTIEDHGVGMLQADFANKFLGGGVLGHGAVQEEIRFLICPELIVSRLFTECLADDEALLIVGAERFSNYTGYASTFRFDSDHQDITPFDSFGRRQTHITAIDALVFRPKDPRQFSKGATYRELDKAYAGLYVRKKLEGSKPHPPFATGNWGCGAFGGDPEYKAMIQWMAASMASRDVVYFTFSDTALADRLRNCVDLIHTNHVTVAQLLRLMLDFGDYRRRRGHKATLGFTEFAEYAISGEVPAEMLEEDEATTPRAADDVEDDTEAEERSIASALAAEAEAAAAAAESADSETDAAAAADMCGSAAMDAYMHAMAGDFSVPATLTADDLPVAPEGPDPNSSADKPVATATESARGESDRTAVPESWDSSFDVAVSAAVDQHEKQASDDHKASDDQVEQRASPSLLNGDKAEDQALTAEPPQQDDSPSEPKEPSS